MGTPPMTDPLETEPGRTRPLPPRHQQPQQAQQPQQQQQPRHHYHYDHQQQQLSRRRHRGSRRRSRTGEQDEAATVTPGAIPHGHTAYSFYGAGAIVPAGHTLYSWLGLHGGKEGPSCQDGNRPGSRSHDVHHGTSNSGRGGLHAAIKDKSTPRRRTDGDRAQGPVEAEVSNGLRRQQQQGGGRRRRNGERKVEGGGEGAASRVRGGGGGGGGGEEEEKGGGQRQGGRGPGREPLPVEDTAVVGVKKLLPTTYGRVQRQPPSRATPPLSSPPPSSSYSKQDWRFAEAPPPTQLHPSRHHHDRCESYAPPQQLVSHPPPQASVVMEEEEFPELGGSSRRSAPSEPSRSAAGSSYAQRLKHGMGQHELVSPLQRASHHKDERRDETAPDGRSGGAKLSLLTPLVRAIVATTPAAVGAHGEDEEEVGGEPPAPTEPSCPPKQQLLQPPPRRMGARFSERMKAKLRDEWAQQSLLRKREALEAQLMRLEDERACALRRLWYPDVYHRDYFSSLTMDGAAEGGGSSGVEEQQQQQQQVVKPGMRGGDRGARDAGWYSFLRPSAMVRGALVAKEVGVMTGEVGGRGGADEARRREDKFFLQLCGLTEDKETSTKDLLALLHAGVYWDAREAGNRRRNAFHVAAYEGRADLLEALAQHAPQGIDSTDRRRATPLLFAAEQGHSECVRLLLKHGARADLKDKAGETALHKAARAGHSQVVLLLLHHVKIGLRSKRRQTALHLAAGGRAELVNLLVSHGADVTALDCDGCLPLTVAARQGATDAMVALLNCNSTASVDSVIETDRSCKHPLIEAAAAGQGGSVRLLLHHRVSSLPVRAAALLRAVKGGFLETVHMIATHLGAAAVLRHADSCITIAARGGHVDCLRYLLALLVPSATSSSLEEVEAQALEAALANEHYACATELVLQGAVVDDALIARTAWGMQKGGKGGRTLLQSVASVHAERRQQQEQAELGGWSGRGGALGEDLWSLFLSGEQNDVVLVLPNGARYGAHRCILAARSEKFHAMFYGSSSSHHQERDRGAFRESTHFEVHVSHKWSHAVFRLFLRYLYTGQAVVMGHEDAQEVVELLVLADEWLCPRLRRQCEHVLGAQLDEAHVEEAMQLVNSNVLGGGGGGGRQGGDLETFCKIIVSSSSDNSPLRSKFPTLLLTQEETEAAMARLSHSPCLDTGSVHGSSHEWVGYPFSDKVEAALAQLTYADLEVLVTCPSALVHRGVREAEGVVIRKAWLETRRAWAKAGDLDRVTNADLLRLDLRRMLHEGLGSDCAVAEEGGWQYATHKAILCARSERIRLHMHFHASADSMASASTTGDTGPSTTTTTTKSSGPPPPIYNFFSLSDRTLLPFLCWVYTDELLLEGCNGRQGNDGDDDVGAEGLVEVAVTADECLMPRLVRRCEELLVSRIDAENCVYLFRVADVIPSLGDLRTAAAAFIVRHFQMLVKKEGARSDWQVRLSGAGGEGEDEEALTPASVLQMAFEALALIETNGSTK